MPKEWESDKEDLTDCRNCLKAAIQNWQSATEFATRDSNEATNLATMLRRGIWLAKKQTGDTGLKVWAGQAYDLLCNYGRQGSPLRK